jgi:hypothetical protein
MGCSTAEGEGLHYAVCSTDETYPKLLKEAAVNRSVARLKVDIRSRDLPKYDVGVVTNYKSHRLFRTFILTILHQLLGLVSARKWTELL